MSDHPPQFDPEPSDSEVDASADALVIYGDFSCPFSALAHRRAVRHARRDSVAFEWRAIEHDPDVPVDGVLLDDAARAGFADELAQIRGLLADDEADDERIPSHRLNTARLSAIHASLPLERRGEFATAVFDAYWREGRNLNDPDEVERFGATATATGERLAREWQREWEGLERRIVPMMRLPDGTLSRGLGALARLQ